MASTISWKVLARIGAKPLIAFIGSVFFCLLGVGFGATLGDALSFPSFGGAAEGYEAGGAFFGIWGISFGALLGTFLLNKILKEERRYTELIVTAFISCLQ